MPLGAAASAISAVDTLVFLVMLHAAVDVPSKVNGSRWCMAAGIRLRNLCFFA